MSDERWTRALSQSTREEDAEPQYSGGTVTGTGGATSGCGCLSLLVIHALYAVGLLAFFAWMNGGGTGAFALSLVAVVAMTLDYVNHGTTGCPLTPEGRIINFIAWLSMGLAYTVRGNHKPPARHRPL